MRIGIWGTSQITATHIDALNKISTTEIVGVYGTHEESGRRLARSAAAPFFSDLTGFASLNPDVILITNSVDMHWATVLRAFSICPNVICEKPLLYSRADFEEFVFAQKSGKVGNIFVVSQKTYNSEFRDFQNEIRKNEIKSISVIIKKKRGKEYFAKQSLSKQLVYSQLPHALDMILSIDKDWEVESIDAKNVQDLENIDSLNVALKAGNCVA
jgi:predicted dehydrogenase